MQNPLDPQRCYQAIQARDARFDGVFFVGVSSTRVYCRPVCRVRTPKAANCAFFPSAAAAEQAGYRPCLRCRPELAPGHAPNDAVRRIAHEAAARIRAGALIDGNVPALARELGLGERQLRRAIERELGVSPIALAQTHRLLLAKQLLTDTRLKVVDIAFASGFLSLRRFNDAFRKHYRMSPTYFRRNGHTAARPDEVVLRLGFRPPLDWCVLVRFLASRGAPGLARLDGERYSATLRIGEHAGWFSAEPDGTRDCLRVTVAPSLLPCLAQTGAALRRLFDLDANPLVIGATLARDRRLACCIARAPGLRIPGALDGFELALRAILGQQVSVKAATTLFGRFVARFGETIETPVERLDRLPPTPAAVADAPLQHVIDLGLTQRRAATIQCLARALADGTLDLTPGRDRTEIESALLAMPGIGPWTAQYIAMRALGDPDALPQADLGLRRALGSDSACAVLAATEAWRPWRAYGAMHLWNAAHAGG